ncbi:hypothetical protein [Vibrio agarivorans]|uniref:TIGR03751 family conjugal transfer lipoprotein n=1 Tax=Vibrio agarivorans TaxID=153622 RepID=A0ABT7Y7B5_9VIBR|nr:hypothetical protein [Vibrio agarivorans]MDN2483944.1 hypothetical protein [Vibrio agarivorans]
MINGIKAVAVIAMLGVLAGCSSNRVKTQEELYQDSVIPQSQRDMKQIYDERSSAGTETNGQVITSDGYMVNKRVATDEEVSVNPYVLNNTAKADFRLLPNPTIYIFFMPSLTRDDRMPRPAWMSEFKLYDRDEYALPGEVSLSGGY